MGGSHNDDETCGIVSRATFEEKSHLIRANIAK